MTMPTPDDRTVVVLLESRLFGIQSEDRTLIVPSEESRILTMPSEVVETRVLIAAPESRVIVAMRG